MFTWNAKEMSLQKRQSAQIIFAKAQLHIRGKNGEKVIAK